MVRQLGQGLTTAKDLSLDVIVNLFTHSTRTGRHPIAVALLSAWPISLAPTCRPSQSRSHRFPTHNRRAPLPPRSTPCCIPGTNPRLHLRFGRRLRGERARDILKKTAAKGVCATMRKRTHVLACKAATAALRSLRRVTHRYGSPRANKPLVPQMSPEKQCTKRSGRGLQFLQELESKRRSHVCAGCEGVCGVVSFIAELLNAAACRVWTVALRAGTHYASRIGYVRVATHGRKGADTCPIPPKPVRSWSSRNCVPAK